MHITSPPTIPDDITRSEPENQSDSILDIIRERGGEASVSKIKFEAKKGSSKKECFIATVPNTHDLIYKPRLSALKAKAKKYDNLLK